MMAEASRRQYSRVLVEQPRIMHPSCSIGKAMSPPGDEGPTFVDAERDAGHSEDAHGVGCDEIDDASVEKEASVIVEGEDSTGGETAASIVLDPDGESRLSDEEGGLKPNGVQEGPPACTPWSYE